jgi:hypothetical protein
MRWCCLSDLKLRAVNDQSLFYSRRTRCLPQAAISIDCRRCRGFAVPQLIHHDDRLCVVEMGIVSPPLVLDFAGAYLDRRPDYPNDVMEEWQADKLEQFGEERRETVQRIMGHFARIGIYLADVKPGNITFAETD